MCQRVRVCVDMVYVGVWMCGMTVCLCLRPCPWDDMETWHDMKTWDGAHDGECEEEEEMQV